MDAANTANWMLTDSVRNASPHKLKIWGATMKVKWEVISEDGYLKVKHSKRGTVCACILRDGKPTDITFLNNADLKNNSIRIPAMCALNQYVSSL